MLNEIVYYSVLVVKMSNLHQTSKEAENEDSESDDDDDEEEEDDEKKPEMSFSFIKHQGCVNRIRVCTEKTITDSLR